MKQALIAVIPVLLIVGVFVLPVVANDTLAKFDGGIGVIPVRAARGWTRPPQRYPEHCPRCPTRWPDLGHRRSGGPGDHGRAHPGQRRGAGVAAARRSAGTTGQHVFATLICGAVAPHTEHHSNLAGVPLAPNGDFTIDDAVAGAHDLRQSGAHPQRRQ